MDKIGIYGGSFNPIHTGHILAISQLFLQGFDKIIVVPCYNHPFGKELISYEHRVNMCRLGLDHLKQDMIEVSTIESKLPAPSYTCNTIQAIIDQAQVKCKYNTIFGFDLEGDFNKWHGIDIIRQLAPPYWMKRISGKSSTLVRQMLKYSRGSSDFSEILPRKVQEYIHKNELYK